MRKILESVDESIIPECVIYEADDGTTAIEEVKGKMEMGVKFDFILIDFTMVRCCLCC